MTSVNAHKFCRFTLFFSIFLFLIVSPVTQAQSPIVITQASLDNQFSKHISQDPRGDFWLSTDTGVYRFDGLHSQKITSHIIPGLKGFSYKHILTNKNLIWLISDVGIEQINTVSQISKTITSQAAQMPKLSENGQLWFINSGELKTYKNAEITTILSSADVGFIQSFILLENNLIWLINKENNLIKYDLSSNKTKKVITLNQAFITLTKNKQGTVWLLNNDFKLKYIKNNTLVDYQPLISQRMYRVISSHDGFLYFYNSKGAFVHNLNSQTTQEVINSDKYPIHNIFLDQKNSLWLQRQNGDWQNYIIPIVKTSQLNKSMHASLKILNHKVPNINHIININDKNWLASNDFGLYLKSNNHDIFQLSNIKNIKNMYYSNANKLWFSDDRLLYSFDLLTKKIISTYRIKNVIAISEINDEQVIATTKNSLYILKNQKIEQIIEPNNDLGSIQDSYYNKNTDLIWLATKEGVWSAILQRESNLLFNKVASGDTSKIYASEKNALWVVINNKLKLFNILTNRFTYENEVEINQPKKQIIQLINKVILNHTIISLQSRQSHYLNSSPKISSISYYDKFDNKHIKIFPQTINNLPSDINTVQVKIADYLGNLNRDYNFEYRLSNQSSWLSLGKGNSTLTLSHLPSGQHILQIHNANDPLIKNTQITFVVEKTPFSLLWYVLLTSICLLLAIYQIIKFKIIKSTPDTLTSALLKQTKEAIWIANNEFKIQKVNDIFTQITGFDESSIINKNPRIYSAKGRNKKLERLIQQELEENNFWSGEVWSCRKNGEEYSLDLSITKVNKSDHNSIPDYQYVGMFSDITIRKCNERELRLLATRDPITQLPNRTLFIEHLDKAISSCTQTFPTFALLFIDLDNFHKINDSLGHSQGDLLIEKLATRLKSKLDKGFTIARLGGDEFAVLIPPYLYSGMTLFYAKRVADSILSLCKSPFNLEGIDISITTSIGISRFPEDGVNCEMLMRSADTALVHAKKNGKNSFQFFDKSQSKSTPELLSQEHNLSQGIENEELVLFYQPKYNTKQNKIVGFEALARWPQLDGTMVSPDDFIPIAESNGMIVPLTLSLFKQACKQIKLWRSSIDLNGRIAINLSARHFQQVDLVKDLTHCLAVYNISGRTIELEVTESAMMDNPDFALKQMKKLKALGFTIALDDFGTGHSSLSYLKKFPIDRLKIDRSFIIDITSSEQDRNITSTIIQLAKYLNIEVIAEGVETKEQAYLLHIMGCQVIQGYYFSRPIPASDVINLIKQPAKIQNS